MTALVTPHCPLCSRRPYAALAGGRQMFCGTLDCKVIIWDATMTIDENLQQINFVDLSGWAQGNEL